MSSPITIAALYRFVELNNFVELREPLLQRMHDLELRGTLLLAGEGINGTVAGSNSAVIELLNYLRQDTRLRDVQCKFSYDSEMPFYRARVKLKREIVTLGVDYVNPNNAGRYVDPEEWNRLVRDPSVTLVDTRNVYESAIGSFENAILTNTKSFRDFPEYAQRNLDPKQHKKIAMFCTGGIRCEKSTAYLREQGFDEVFHLKGGILSYLEKIPESDSLWRGECFVFDNRVSVNHRLEKGRYDQCHACRLPITDTDKNSDKYQPGVSCPACFEQNSEQQRNRFREREKQVRLATKRGENHLGVDAATAAKARKTLKLKTKNLQRQQHY